MVALKRFRHSGPSFSDLLPYAALIDNGTLLLKDGSLMAGWYFAGPDSESSTDFERNEVSRQINSILARLGSGWMIQVEAVRVPATAYPARDNCHFPDKVSALIDEERRKRFEAADGHYESQHAIILTYREPEKRKSGLVKYVYSDDESRATTFADRARDHFRRSIREFEQYMGNVVSIRRMVTQETEERGGSRIAKYDDLLQFARFCIVGENHPVRLPDIPMYLDFVVTAEFHHGLSPLVDNRYLAVVAIDGFPAESWPGILNSLDLMPLTYRWSSRFVFLDSVEARQRLERTRKKWLQKVRPFMDQLFQTNSGAIDQDAALMVAETEDAIAEANSQLVAYGYYTPVIVMFDDDEQSVQILANLRSLSGQLALKLISARTQQAEALGLALARLYLEYQGALGNQVIVPLDAHTDLYRASGESDDVNDAISLQRTDLGLFDLDLNARTITCNLVEVKCYSQLGDFAAFNQLKERISAQINQSERILQRHFDPALKKPDRPDRLLKSRELAQILRFYLERSLRYGIFDATAAQEARGLLESIEQGYSLQFRRCAVIFDFDKTGTEAPDNEVGIEFHRIGKDLIHALLENCRKPVSVEIEEEPTAHLLSEQFIPNVPKLETAAFIAPKRARSTSWTVDELSDEDPEAPITQPTPPAAEETPSSAQEDKEEQAEPVEQAPRPSTIAPEEEKEDEQPDAIAVGPEEPVQPELEAPEHPTPEPAPQAEVSYDIMLGVNGDSPQYGLLGEVSGRKIALDLNHTHTISLFGVQGGGKSYTLGTVIEMASMPLQHINVLPSPLSTVIFHYSPTQDYAPEFTSMINANSVDEEIRILRERYKANPEALKDVLILTPATKVDDRQAEYPDIEVKPIAFSASELKAAHWKFLMGAIGSQSMYMRQINLIMRGLRDNLTLDALRAAIDNSGLSDHLKELAQTRLLFASEYIDDGQRLQDLIRPGRLIIVDLRDEYIEKYEALGLFVVMLQIFSEATYQGTAFNKLVVFDEAHKYIENDDLVSGLVEVVREMRHKGTSIMVASQDPPSVPVSLIELSSQIIMHKFNSPAWLKHIQKANAALGELTSDKMSHLGTGEAYVWSSKASDEAFTRGAVKIKCRPRITQHGGSTKTAIGR